MRVRDIALTGILAAVLLGVQTALAFLPNIELVTLLVIVFTLKWKKKVFYTIYVFALLEILIYGVGFWSISYLYVWTVLAGIVLLCKRHTEPLFWAFVAGFFGLGFGALTAVPYLAAGGVKLALAYWTAGIMFDIVHFAGNFISVLVLFKPLHRVTELADKER